jgi:hypothetical protein
MSNPFLPVNVSVGAVPRGAGTQLPSNFVAQSMTASFAWGSSPGTATVVYVGSGSPIVTGALVTLTIGGHFYAGICKSDVQNYGSGEGLTRTLQFADLREFLTWDYTFCVFNKSDVRLIGGVRVKRYKHLLPDDVDSRTWTYTSTPYNASQIIGAILAGPTIGTSWAYDLTGGGTFPGGVMNFPVFDFDCELGKRLDAAFSQICQDAGCVFGLASTPAVPYRLVFTRKGYGPLPTPPLNSDNQRIGVALSGHPTNVRVLGERNLYQVMDVGMEPDWARAWEQFVVFEIFSNFIYHALGYDATPGDPEGYVGRQLANARALSITVGEFAAIAGEQFADLRKYAGRSRMDMPAALYISTLLFRAFRPASGFSFVNAVGTGIPLTSLDIADRLLCKVFQNDPTSGTLQFDPAQPTDGNGFVIAKGYMVGADLFKSIKSDQFNLNFFTNASAVWQHIPFQIDDSGEGVRFIIFDEPVIVSDNLVTQTDGHAAINAQFTLTVPPVVAALVFEAERFSYWKGTFPSVSRDTVENVGGLNLELVGPLGSYTEIAYSNGETAAQKADVIASSVLLRQYLYTEGGHKYIWDPHLPINQFGTPLSSMVDRVQISTSPKEGTYEVVDYTNERQRDFFEPERELDRRTQTNSLFPGQAELRVQAEYSRKLAAAFKQFPSIGRRLTDLLSGAIGSDDPLDVVWFNGAIDLGGLGLMPAGTVIRRTPSASGSGVNTVATAPDAIGPEDTIFMGVTVRDSEDPTGSFKVQKTGVALVRVQGPVNATDAVGLADSVTGWEYLTAGGIPPVGVALQSITDTSVRLIQVSLGTGGGGSAGRYRLKGMADDYLICRSWDGTTEGTKDVYIAKEFKHRNSLTTETEYATPMTYTYTPDGTDPNHLNVLRHKTDGTDTELQHILPIWTLDEEIGAIQQSTGVIADDGSAVTLLIQGRSAEWGQL